MVVLKGDAGCGTACEICPSWIDVKTVGTMVGCLGMLGAVTNGIMMKLYFLILLSLPGGKERKGLKWYPMV